MNKGKQKQKERWKRKLKNSVWYIIVMNYVNKTSVYMCVYIYIYLH